MRMAVATPSICLPTTTAETGGGGERLPQQERRGRWAGAGRGGGESVAHGVGWKTWPHGVGFALAELLAVGFVCHGFLGPLVDVQRKQLTGRQHHVRHITPQRWSCLIQDALTAGPQVMGPNAPSARDLLPQLGAPRRQQRCTHRLPKLNRPGRDGLYQPAFLPTAEGKLMAAVVCVCTPQ